MPTFVVAQCDACKAKCLDVQVGRKSTEREVHCRLCGARWSYSAWRLKSPKPGVDLTQIEFVRLEDR